MSLYEQVLPDYDELLADQQTSQLEGSTLTVSADSEQATAFVDAFMQSSSGALPDAFMPLPVKANPFSDPENVKQLINPRDKAIAVLSRLPFVTNDDMDWDRQSYDGRRLVIQGDLYVPAERIIAVRSFKNWQTGLNSPANAERKYTPDALGLGPGSLNAMITYSSLLQESQPKNDGSLLVVATDTDGEYWGVLDCDGSHRAGSQKLRGDSHIQVAKTVVHTDETMPLIAYGVRDRFGVK